MLAPAWSDLDTYDGHNATNIGLQADADAVQGPQIDRLLAYVQAHPKGRVYAGSPTNWGQDFTVGAVPVFKYLESKDIDEVGYTLRTASLMTDPEYYFDETNPGDYPLFGIGYIITPATMESPVAADKVGCSGTYCLWALPHTGYIHVYDTTGVLTATRADVGTQSATLLTSPLLGQQRDLTVAFNGEPAATPTASDPSALKGSPGRVVVEHADLENGTARAVVRTNRRSTVVLSASYDPGWHATVNGRAAPTVMVAPALVGVVVGPGTHTVAFSYGGYGSYDALFVLALVVLAVLALAPLVWRRVRTQRRGQRVTRLVDGAARRATGGRRNAGSGVAADRPGPGERRRARKAVGRRVRPHDRVDEPGTQGPRHGGVCLSFSQRPRPPGARRGHEAVVPHVR